MRALPVAPAVAPGTAEQRRENVADQAAVAPIVPAAIVPAIAPAAIVPASVAPAAIVPAAVAPAAIAPPGKPGLRVQRDIGLGFFIGLLPRFGHRPADR